jgi:hypothetical protein
MYFHGLIGFFFSAASFLDSLCWGEVNVREIIGVAGIEDQLSSNTTREMQRYGRNRSLVVGFSLYSGKSSLRVWRLSAYDT